MRTQLETTETVRRATLADLLQRGEALLVGMDIETARLDAELLLAHVLGCRRATLWLAGDAPVTETQHKRFEAALARRARREPVAYIVGTKEFWSLDFVVTADVLVPRPETELLVETATGIIERSPISNFGLRILDLGTGSGAIAVSLARECADVEIWATDLSQKALRVAAANAARHEVSEKLHFLEGDLFSPVKKLAGTFDLIVSNPPYVRRGEMARLPSEVRDWEPGSALDGGLDGLDFYRRISADGRDCLQDGGFVLLEIGADMGDEVSRLFNDTGFYAEVGVRPDYAGRDRVVVARKRA